MATSSAVAMGPSTLVMVAGTPTASTWRNDRLSWARPGTCRSRALSLKAVHSAYTNPTTRDSAVARAAPSSPSPGIGPQPKIRIGSKIALAMAIRTITLRGVVASPWPRSTPLRIIGTTSTTALKNQMVM